MKLDGREGDVSTGLIIMDFGMALRNELMRGVTQSMELVCKVQNHG